MPHLAENTRRVNARVWETHARELLGGVHVKLARTSTFEDLQLTLLERDPPVGAETVRKLMTMLQSVMALAERDETLPTVTVNVVAAVRRPSAPRRRGLAVWPTTVEALRSASWQTGTKRGSFASLLIQEGTNVVDVAKQLGHTPETCLRYYARLFDEAPEHPVPAEEAIRAARRQLAQSVSPSD